MTRLVAIHGGGDWYDASADYVVLLVEADTDELWKEYRQWYWNRGKTHQEKYLNFPEWLVEKGHARKADESDIEIFSDGP